MFNIVHKINHNIAYILLNIFQYCTYCTNCTSSHKLYILPILYKIARYCTKLLNIACCCTSCYKLYILPILLKIAPHCLCKSWRWRSCYMGCQMFWTETTVSLTYFVLFCIPRTPSSPGCQNGKARESRNPRPKSAAAVRCDQRGASWGTGVGHNAARKRRTKAILESALAKQWENGEEAGISVLWRAFEQYFVQYWTIWDYFMYNSVYNFVSNIG